MTVRETDKSDTEIEFSRALNIDAVFASDQIFIISFLFISIFAIIFANVITAGYTKHGEVRYFFGSDSAGIHTYLCADSYRFFLGE